MRAGTLCTELRTQARPAWTARDAPTSTRRFVAAAPHRSWRTTPRATRSAAKASESSVVAAPLMVERRRSSVCDLGSSRGRASSRRVTPPPKRPQASAVLPSDDVACPMSNPSPMPAAATRMKRATTRLNDTLGSFSMQRTTGIARPFFAARLYPGDVLRPRAEAAMQNITAVWTVQAARSGPLPASRHGASGAWITDAKLSRGYRFRRPS
jgi:hypothetical protein